MTTLSDERVAELFLKPMDKITREEIQELIDHEQHLLDELKPFKDWVKDSPNMFPAISRVYKQRLEEL